MLPVLPLTSQQAGIRRAIRLVNPAERNHVIKYTRLFLTPDMSWEDCKHIIKTLKHVLAAERENLITMVKLMVTPQMTGQDRAYLLNTSKIVSSEERTEVLTLAKCLMSDHTDFNTAVQIINTIWFSSTDDREAIALALPLIAQHPDKFDETLPWKHCLAIIQLIQQLPAQERQSFVEQASLFIRPSMNIYGRKVIAPKEKVRSPSKSTISDIAAAYSSGGYRINTKDLITSYLV